MGHKLAPKISSQRAISRGVILVLLLGLAVGVVTTQRLDVQAATIGNTDIYEDGFNGFPQSWVSSGWWGGTSKAVTQRYGCTSDFHEDYSAGIAHGCPGSNTYWHNGIDIGGTGTLYSQVTGTVVESASGVLGVQTGNGVVINLIHGTPLVASGTVNVGTAVYSTGSLTPCGGTSTGVHLHFEVHKSRYPWCSSLNDDINPEEWLLTQCSVGGSAAGPVGLTGVVAAGSYLSWYDRASAGFNNETVHVLNPTDSSRQVTVALAQNPQPITLGTATLSSGQEWNTQPSQSSGGPVSVTGAGLLASRRTQYYNSFNETNGVGGASTDQFLPWFDKLSTGFCADNIHVTNPSNVAANVTVSGTGLPSLPSVQIPAGQGAYFSWAPGWQGGPIEIISDQPVIASERIIYMHSLSENNAIPRSSLSQHVWFSWYDNATKDVFGDDIHIVNPNTSNDCYVSVSAPNLQTQLVTVRSSLETYARFPASSTGGPVKVDAISPDGGITPPCPGILAFERTIWNGSFKQVDGMRVEGAATQLYFNWYDKASSGMVADNIHLSNPSVGTASIIISVPGASSLPVSLAPGAGTYVNFPGVLGGPVTISSSQPILASERIQFYNSFHEMSALGFP